MNKRSISAGPDTNDLRDGVHILTSEVFEGQAEDLERTRLEIPPDSLIYRLSRVRSIRGKPFLSETATLTKAMFPGLPQHNLTTSSLTAIAAAYGVLLGKAVETVSPGRASPATAKTLQIVEGSPVLYLERVVRTRDGRAAELRRAECLATR